MTSNQQTVIKADPALGLILLLCFLLGAAVGLADAPTRPQFDSIDSTCIDLACYNSSRQELTVRFVNRQRDRFYTYSSVTTNVWQKLKTLDASGASVGAYFIETVVKHPEKYSFKEIRITDYEVVPSKKKAGDSK